MALIPALDAGTPRPNGRVTATTPRTRFGTLAAYSYRVPLCVPFWSGATYLAIARCLATGRVRHGTHVRRLEARVASLLGTSATLACASGTTALEYALAALGVGRNDEVLVPTLCCESVPQAVLAVGAVPVLVDIQDDLSIGPDQVDTGIGERTRAVIVPHLFGNPADIVAIRERCRARGIHLIDDAAQALGADIGGRSVGTFGSAGVLSFGNGKVCFGTGGGVLVATESELLDRAAQLRRQRGPEGGCVRRVLGTVILRRWRRQSLPVHVIAERVLGRRAGPRRYRHGSMCNIDAAVALTLLDTLPANLAARRERAFAYRQLLADVRDLACVPHRAGSACLTQVVRIEPSAQVQAADLAEALRREGVEAQLSYAPLHLLPRFRDYARGPLTNAERLANRLLELPCEPSVSLSEVDRISAIVRRTVS